MTATVANANLIESALAYYSPQKQSQRLYEKQREEDILQNAIDHGYLKSPCASDIISVSEDLQEEDIDILDKVLIVTFGLARLQKIDELRTCINLTICNLCCNFIKDIEPLKCCTSLVKLDLHGNQVCLNHNFVSKTTIISKAHHQMGCIVQFPDWEIKTSLPW